MADFSSFIKKVSTDGCSKQVTLTMSKSINDNDTITFPVGTTYVSSVTNGGGDFQPNNNILKLSKIVDDNTVTMLCPDVGPYLIDYYNGSEHYYEPIYFDCDIKVKCDDCYSCEYINHGRLYNKRVSGLLTYAQYSGDHDKYMLNFVYNENVPEQIQMNDADLDLADEDNPINGSLYSKFLVLTYLSYDPDNGKFYEQIVYSSGINEDSSWNYDIEKNRGRCFYHNQECIEVDEDFTNVTLEVEYISELGTELLTATKVYPILYKNDITKESGKKYVDGIYKTYYFMVRKITNGTMADIRLLKGNAIRFLGTIGTMDYTLVAKDNLTISTTPTTITINSVTYDSSNINDMLVWFTQVETEIDDVLTYEPLEMLKTIPFLNTGVVDESVRLQQIMAEEMHIITYELAYDILESIEDCSVPCERFSFDEWMGLRQKHLAANTHFCKGNIMKAALEIYTSRKRCKNC